MVNNLEKLFDYSFNILLKEKYMVINETDFPLFLIKQSNTRFKPKQIPDRILLSRKRNVVLEMKENKGNSMRFDRIKPHQLDFLIEFSKMAGDSYLILSFNELNEIIFIEISMFEELIDLIKKKSFSTSDLKKYPDCRIQIIDNYERKAEDKKFRNRCLDLLRFL